MNALRHTFSSERVALSFTVTVGELTGLPARAEGVYLVEWRRGKLSGRTRSVHPDGQGSVYFDQQFPAFKATLFRKRESVFHKKLLKLTLFQAIHTGEPRRVAQGAVDLAKFQFNHRVPLETKHTDSLALRVTLAWEHVQLGDARSTGSRSSQPISEPSSHHDVESLGDAEEPMDDAAWEQAEEERLRQQRLEEQQNKMADPEKLKLNALQWERLRDDILALGLCPERPALERALVKCSVVRRPLQDVQEEQRVEAERGIVNLQAQLREIKMKAAALAEYQRFEPPQTRRRDVQRVAADWRDTDSVVDARPPLPRSLSTVPSQPQPQRPSTGPTPPSRFRPREEKTCENCVIL